MNNSTSLLLGGATTIVIALLLLVLLLRRLSSGTTDARGKHRARGARYDALQAPQQPPPKDKVSEAAALLDQIQRLQRSENGWPGIAAELNPRNDAAIAAHLLALRGPHLFAPHLALDIIAATCREHADRQSSASVYELLSDARRSAERVTRYGD